MAGLAVGSPLADLTGGSNPDVGLLYDINGLAAGAPHWLDRLMGFLGEYGIVIGCVVLALCAWWRARSRPGAPAAVAGLLWAPLAAGLALLVNIPVRGIVRRPRPFLDHQGLDVLIKGKHGFSFVSDHATLTMALGVGLFIVNRTYGLVGIGLAVLEGFCRVYMGVHYPTDVVGGFALGTAVALLLAPLAMMALTPLVTIVADSRAGRLIRSRRAVAVAAAEGDAGAAIHGGGAAAGPGAARQRDGSATRGDKGLAA